MTHYEAHHSKAFKGLPERYFGKQKPFKLVSTREISKVPKSTD